MERYKSEQASKSSEAEFQGECTSKKKSKNVELARSPKTSSSDNNEELGEYEEIKFDNKNFN